jgi:SAM-dependent methyltransferase
MRFGAEVISPSEVYEKKVLEVGACNVNGSLSSIVCLYRPLAYVGTDMQTGPGVDILVEASRLMQYFQEERFDLVICTEMLEHCEDWKSAIQNIFGVCKPGGVMLITARGPGAGYHPYPNDYWRFTVKDVRMMFDANEIEYLREDPEYPGFLAKIRKTGDMVFTDFEVDRV